jgi:hypothetical protein
MLVRGKCTSLFSYSVTDEETRFGKTDHRLSWKISINNVTVEMGEGLDYQVEKVFKFQQFSILGNGQHGHPIPSDRILTD